MELAGAGGAATGVALDGVQRAERSGGGGSRQIGRAVLWWCMCFGVVFPSILFGRLLLQRLGRSTVASSLQPSGAGASKCGGSSALLCFALILARLLIA